MCCFAAACRFMIPLCVVSCGICRQGDPLQSVSASMPYRYGDQSTLAHAFSTILDGDLCLCPCPCPCSCLCLCIRVQTHSIRQLIELYKGDHHRRTGGKGDWSTEAGHRRRARLVPADLQPPDAPLATRAKTRMLRSSETKAEPLHAEPTEPAGSHRYVAEAVPAAAADEINEPPNARPIRACND